MKNPRWKILLRWLLEKGDDGLSVLEIITTTREGCNLAASYRQIILRLRRERFGTDEAIRTESVTVDGQVRTTYYLESQWGGAAEVLLQDAYLTT